MVVTKKRNPNPKLIVIRDLMANSRSQKKFKIGKIYTLDIFITILFILNDIKNIHATLDYRFLLDLMSFSGSDHTTSPVCLFTQYFFKNN